MGGGGVGAQPSRKEFADLKRRVEKLEGVEEDAPDTLCVHCESILSRHFGPTQQCPDWYQTGNRFHAKHKIVVGCTNCDRPWSEHTGDPRTGAVCPVDWCDHCGTQHAEGNVCTRVDMWVCRHCFKTKGQHRPPAGHCNQITDWKYEGVRIES